MYTIQRAIQKLWLNRKAYFFIVLELAIGIAATLCGFLSSHSARNRLEICTNQCNSDDVMIEYYSDRGAVGTAITYEDYCDFSSMYETRFDFTYFLYTNSVYWQKDNNTIENFVVLSMDSDAFLFLFGIEQLDAIYVGKNIATALEGGEIFFAESWLQMDRDTAQVGNEIDIQILPLNTGAEKIVTRGLKDFDLDVSQLVILPESMQDELERNSRDLLSFLRLRPIGQFDTNLCCEITEALSKRHTEYSYTFVNVGKELEQAITDLTQEIRVLSWISKLTLSITTVGIVGILFLFLQHRRREYAIALTQGATHQILFQELFCEVLLLNILGGIIGTLAVAMIAPHLSTSMFTVVFQWSALLIVLLIVLVVTVCSCICMLTCIRSIYPVKLMRS